MHARIAAVVVAGLGAWASGGIETQTVHFDNDLYSEYQSPAIQKFDTQGGTRRLDAVTISFDHHIDTVLTLENASPTPISASQYGFQFLMQALFQLGTVEGEDDNPPFVGAGGFATDPWSVDLPAYGGPPVDPWGPAPGVNVFYSDVLTASNAVSDRYTNLSPDVLAALTGTGFLQTVLGGFGEGYMDWIEEVEGGLIFAGVHSLRHYGSLTITYEYSMVPAPGGVALLGVAGVLAGRRRR